jgi:hypothetical protein
MVIDIPGFSLLKSIFGLAALMALSGKPYIAAIVARLSPGPSTGTFFGSGGNGGGCGGCGGKS